MNNCKNLSVALCIMMCGAVSYNCSGNQQEQTSQEGTTSVAPKKEKKAEAPTDVFFYTGQHRKDKFQPTEPKLGFSSQIGSINNDEFKGNLSIEEVWIAPAIKHIANNAFEGCKNLKQVHFQGFVPVVNDESFKGCSSLQSLKLDASTIGLEAFKGCSSLQSAEFGEHIWWIREGAFAGCSKLKKLLLHITMQKLEDGAFDGCTSMEEFSVPNDFKNRMFGMFPQSEKWRKVYLLATEYFDMPKNCTPGSKCTLYVPDVFVEQYRSNAEWAKFGAIEPLSKSQYYTAEGFKK